MRLSILDQSPISEGSSPAEALRNSVDLAQLGDRLGYERYWIAEHHGTAISATTAPEVMVGVIAQATGRIRVGSGAVLLPHYAPFKVAELFRTLHALFPGRIDLGVGRGPGAGAAETAALSRGRKGGEFTPDDFPARLSELRALLHGGFAPGHPLARVRVQPEGAGAPELWVVGSSPWASAGAGQLGLPYAYAHFIGPAHTRMAMKSYQQAFRPTPLRAAAKGMVAIGVLCADTDAAADRIASSLRAVARRTERGVQGAAPSIEDALKELAGQPEPPEPDPGQWRRVIIGGPDKVRAQLQQIAEALGVDEVMANTITHDHADRRRSYELLAQAFGLELRHT